MDCRRDNLHGCLACFVLAVSICCSHAARTGQLLQPLSLKSARSRPTGQQLASSTPSQQQLWQQQQTIEQHAHFQALREPPPGLLNTFNWPTDQAPKAPASKPVDPEAKCPTHHYKAQCKGLKGCIWCINKFSPYPGSDGVCIAVEDAWELPSWTYECLYHSSSSSSSSTAEMPVATSLLLG